jgi:hypothetical protein
MPVQNAEHPGRKAAFPAGMSGAPDLALRDVFAWGAAGRPA